jgi:hypothetical protein
VAPRTLKGFTNSVSDAPVFRADVAAKGVGAHPFLADNLLTLADVEVRSRTEGLDLASSSAFVPVADDTEGVRTAWQTVLPGPTAAGPQPRQRPHLPRVVQLSWHRC